VGGETAHDPTPTRQVRVRNALVMCVATVGVPVTQAPESATHSLRHGQPFDRRLTSLFAKRPHPSMVARAGPAHHEAPGSSSPWAGPRAGV